MRSWCLLACLLFYSFGARAIIGADRSRLSAIVAQSTVGLKIFKDDGLDFATCTGVLIAPDIVLTAAHCVPLRTGATSARPNQVLFTNDFARSGSESEWSGVVVHPGYHYRAAKGERDFHDLALIRVTPPPHTEFTPVQFRGSATALAVGSELLIAGFGQRRDGLSVSALNTIGKLRQVGKVILRVDTPEAGFVINQEDARGACRGDSGGPAFLRANGEWSLVGILHGALPEDPIDCVHHSFYTEISPYREWIEKSMSELRGSR